MCLSDSSSQKEIPEEQKCQIQIARNRQSMPEFHDDILQKHQKPVGAMCQEFSTGLRSSFDASP